MIRKIVRLRNGPDSTLSLRHKVSRPFRSFSRKKKLARRFVDSLGQKFSCPYLIGLIAGYRELPTHRHYNYFYHFNRSSLREKLTWFVPVFSTYFWNHARITSRTSIHTWHVVVSSKINTYFYPYELLFANLTFSGCGRKSLQSGPANEDECSERNMQNLSLSRFVFCIIKMHQKVLYSRLTFSPPQSNTDFNVNCSSRI